MSSEDSKTVTRLMEATVSPFCRFKIPDPCGPPPLTDAPSARSQEARPPHERDPAFGGPKSKPDRKPRA